MEIANGVGVVFLKFAIQIRIVILSEAKDLLSYQRTKQQVLRFAQDDNIISGISGRSRSAWLSDQFPPAPPSYRDANAPGRALAPCSRFGGDCVSTRPEWFVSRRRGRGRLAGRCLRSQNRVGQLKWAARARRFQR